MEKVMIEMHMCSICGKLFKDEASCIHHEKGFCTSKSRWKAINEKWEKGYTLGEINDDISYYKNTSG